MINRVIFCKSGPRILFILDYPCPHGLPTIRVSFGVGPITLHAQFLSGRLLLLDVNFVSFLRF